MRVNISINSNSNITINANIDMIEEVEARLVNIRDAVYGALFD
jgi:hypothetical protein